jgi:P27 family predicted phage terminase small subunit
MKGRKPIATNVHMINGNPSKKNLNTNEPQYEDYDISNPPDYLTGKALEYWETHAPELSAAGVLTIADAYSFAALCSKYGDWREYETEKKNSPNLIRTPSGYVQQNPYISMANKAYELFCKLLPEFGLTPSSRSRLSIDKPMRQNGIKNRHFD